MGALTWPNGFDLDPINPYMELRDAGLLTRVAAEQEGGGFVRTAMWMGQRAQRRAYLN
jgi:hypothetical protein